MPVKLTPTQVENLRDVLLSAFERGDLRQITYFAIDESFEDVVGQGNFREQVYDLARYVNKFGKVELLLAKARQVNPGNTDLEAFERQLHAGGASRPAAASDYQPTIDLKKAEKDSLKHDEALLFAKHDARLPFSFVEGAMRTARSIARLAVPRYFDGEPDGEQMCGTGWLIAPDLLITNHHVIEARDRSADGLNEQPAAAGDFVLQAEHAIATFDYYTGDEPDDRAPELRNGKLLAKNEELDYAIIKYADTKAINDGKAPARLPLKILQKDPVLSRGARLNIVQHPQGKYMRYAIRNNFYVRKGEETYQIRYQTDTEPGASGSPVCNDQWTVVGLHHASVQVDAQIVSQEATDGQVVPVTMLNEAITLAAILESLPADLRKRIIDAQAELK